MKSGQTSYTLTSHARSVTTEPSRIDSHLKHSIRTEKINQLSINIVIMHQFKTAMVFSLTNRLVAIYFES